MNNIILISVGNFQNYIIDNIDQLLLFDYNIHVITDKRFFSLLKKYDKLIKIIATEELQDSFSFNKRSKLNKSFRNGFIHYASQRLFLLYEYMKKYDIKHVLHLENDVLLYKKFDFKFDDKIYLTMDSDTRGIPGIIYIPEYHLLDNLITNYQFNQDDDDMINLGLFYNNNKNIIKTLPIIDDDTFKKSIFNENFSEFNSIFDAAAIGQYLGGVDPRNIPGNTIGFVNETCVVKYNKYKFTWVNNNNLNLPHIEINNKLIPINNLHIHCKNLKSFMSNKIIL